MQDEYTDQPEASVVADLAKRAAVMERTTTLKGADLGEMGTFVASDGRLVAIDPDALLGLAPRNKRGMVSLRTTQDLALYHDRHKGEEGATVVTFADQDRLTFTTLLNTHSKEEAGRGDHRAEVQLRRTPEWAAVLAANGRRFDQQTLAEWLEQWGDVVVSPDAATVMELASTFQQQTAVEFRSSTRLSDGQRQLTYVEKKTSQAGAQGDMQVPEKLELGVRPFEGSEAYRVTASLRYRVNDGSLSIAFVLLRPEEVERVAFEEQATVLSARLATEFLFGVAPTPDTPPITTLLG